MKCENCKINLAVSSNCIVFNGHEYDFCSPECAVAWEKKQERKFHCCLCGKIVLGYGNNPDPVMNKGECCDECNNTKVIPARLKQVSK